MNPIEFPEQDIIIGEEQGYRALPIRRMRVAVGEGVINTYISKWLPTADELKLLAEGKPVTVLLRTAINGHPPIKLDVEP